MCPEFFEPLFQLFSLVVGTLERPQVHNALAVLGLIIFTKYTLTKIIKAANAFRIYVLPRIGQRWLKFGEWAVVTGSTDGIGLEFARQLAAKKLNIILISRNPERLKKVADEIELEFNVKTKTICINFTAAVPVTYKKLEEELKSYNIGILVNNVGVYMPYPMPFDHLTPENLWDHIVVNCGAVSMMTRLILPQMKKRQRGGMVVNVSSAGSLYPLALVSSFSASKAYMNLLTEALRKENDKSGIHFLTLKPFPVATKLAAFSDQISSPSLFVPSAKNYVKSALRTFGTVEETSGYFPHAIVRGSSEIFPWVYRWCSSYVLNSWWKENTKATVNVKKNK